MENYTKVDLANWPRREHYAYYTESLKIQYNLTSEVQVDKLLDFCHKNEYKFYPVLIYAVTKVINSIENLRMFKNADGELCIWDSVLPNYTFFHDDDKTFSDCWCEYSEDFDECYKILTDNMEKYKDVKGIKARPDQPGNFYCISCVPWLNFTCFTSRVTNGEPQFFPIVTVGKYEEKDGKIMMPVNFMIAHAVCDGYHAALFFERLQKEINSFENL